MPTGLEEACVLSYLVTVYRSVTLQALASRMYMCSIGKAKIALSLKIVELFDYHTS